MSTKITKEFDVEITTKARAKVQVTFPLYRKHDLMPDDGDSVIYSRIDAELNEVSIQITERYRNGAKQYDLEFDQTRIDGSDYSLARGRYASNEAEFLAALREMNDALRGVEEKSA